MGQIWSAEHTQEEKIYVTLDSKAEYIQEKKKDKNSSRMFALQQTLLRKLTDKPYNGRKSLHIIYMNKKSVSRIYKIL